MSARRGAVTFVTGVVLCHKLTFVSDSRPMSVGRGVLDEFNPDALCLFDRR